MASPFDAIALDFVAFAVECAGSDAAAKVTVESVNPDTGAALATATGVYAVKRARRRFPFSAEGGGSAGADLCRFVLLASPITFALKAKDRVTDAGGTVWVVDKRGADLVAMGNLWTANVSRKRS